jgi:hypothetical protein
MNKRLRDIETSLEALKTLDSLTLIDQPELKQELYKLIIFKISAAFSDIDNYNADDILQMSKLLLLVKKYVLSEAYDLLKSLIATTIKAQMNSNN